jgi:hypothetical protein
MRRLPFLASLAVTLLLLTTAACSNGSGMLSSNTGGSAGGANSAGVTGSVPGGAGGNSGAVVSSGTGGAGGNPGLGGTAATISSSAAGGSGGASSGGRGGAGLGGSASAGSSAASAGASAIAGSPVPGGSRGTATGGAGLGGSASAGSAAASAGATATSGSSSRGGSGGTAAGGTRSGGASGSGGTVGSGGRTGSGGAGGAGGTAAPPGDGGVSSTCGTGTTPAPNPFGCTFAWGVNGNPTSYLQFASAWAGYNIKADGTFPANGFDSGNWLKSFASTTAVPAYYAYILGYYGHANGLQDGNVNPGGPNLTNGMGPLLLGVLNAACPQGTICADNLMVKAYAWYATQTYAAYKKPVIWLLEGDFIQYSVEGSTSGLSYAQLGQLAAQIALAIKCNDPPAVVAENYSTWISTSQLNSYIGEMNTAMAALGTSYDMIWTTGKGTSANAGGSETWAALHTFTGKPILVDESFGLSAAGDSWANQTADTINARIAGGVVAANITTSTPSYLQTNVTTTLAPSALGSTCP